MYGVTREPVTMALRTSKRRLHNLALCSEAPTCTEIENAQATRG
jgi:hypothetical protein